jgi:hypothetical protein
VHSSKILERNGRECARCEKEVGGCSRHREPQRSERSAHVGNKEPAELSAAKIHGEERVGARKISQLLRD